MPKYEMGKSFIEYYNFLKKQNYKLNIYKLNNTYF